MGLRALLAAPIFVFALATLARAATIHVPGEQPDIQTGIGSALAGDTVLVSSGIYSENIDFNGKAIVLVSSGGRDSTVIQSATVSVPVVTFAGGEDSLSVLDGFAVVGASFASGVHCNGSDPIIQNCDISGNTGPEWGGGVVCVSGAAPTIRYNRIHDNQAKFGGAIGARVSTAPEIAYNQIYSNSGTRPGIAIEGGTAKAHHNIVRDNLGGQALYGRGSGSRVTVTRLSTTRSSATISESRPTRVPVRSSTISLCLAFWREYTTLAPP